MFALIGLLVVLGILALCFRDWVMYGRLSNRRVKKQLAKAQKALLLNHFQRAEKALIPLYENGLGGIEMWLLFAHVLRGTHRFDEALRFVRFGKQKYKNDWRFALEEGKIHLANQRPKKALATFEQCSAFLREEQDILPFAKALFACGYLEKCHALLEPFLLTTKDPALLRLGGDLYFKVGHFEKAHPYYTQAVETSEHHPTTLKSLAACKRKLGELTPAEELYRTILKKAPKDLEALLGLGACYQEMGYFQKAFSLYQAAAPFENQNAPLLTQMGIMALQTKRFALAEKCFSCVLSNQPPTPKLLSYLGYSFECQQKWQEAETIYLEMTATYPEHPNGFRALAWLFGVGLSPTIDPSQGISFANQALKLLPDPLSWEILSACLARAGKFQKAHEIQATLLSDEECSQTRARRQQAMRHLRKQLPLEQSHLPRSKVA